MSRKFRKKSPKLRLEDLSELLSRQIPALPKFVVNYSKRRDAPSVEIDELYGPDRWRLAEQTAGLRFTGLAAKWTCKLRCQSRGVDLHLCWKTPDRGDASKVIDLIYHDYAPAADDRLSNVVAWIHEALRYVFLHEADETIVLHDGVRPFDPHAKTPLLRPLTETINIPQHRG